MKIGSRKFVITLIIFLITSLLCLLNKIDQDVYQAISSWIFAGYVVGNLGEHIVKKNQ